MDDLTSQTVAVFTRAFTVPGCVEMLPAGEYDIQAEPVSPPDHLHPEAWKASVLVTLHPRVSCPGLAGPLTVSLADLDRARARDKLTGRVLSNFFLDEMLADPMVHLVMQADGVSETQLRHLYAGLGMPRSDMAGLGASRASQQARNGASIQVAENEGMPARSEGMPLLRPQPMQDRYDGDQDHG